ncbi:MAG: succinate dehydrogenase cytochrome b subunit [Acidobacteria bacterium]|nr:succinate dehydrogenase cytochrome b subunit [Acidobacteriota bacterium]
MRRHSTSKYNRSDRGASVMSTFRRAFSSSVGTKLLMGLTGLALFVYLVLHLIGNALIFFGPDLFNEYSHRLVSNPLIIPIEIGLLAIFLLHIYKAATNYMANRAARPVGYRMKRYAGHTSRKSVASSTMIWSGLVIVFFVAVHVKQFKYGAWYQTVSDNPIRDLARTEFDVAFYSVATLIVGLHLRHGVASSFQSLGIDHPLYTRRLTTWGIILAVIIGGGLACIPVWVYLTR